MAISIRNFSRGALAALLFLLTVGAGTEVLAQAADAKRFNYLYERPRGLSGFGQQAVLAVPAIPQAEAVAAGRQKALRLAEALGVKFTPNTTIHQLDDNREILRIKDAGYRLKVYVPSGMVKFRDTQLHNQIPGPDIDRTAFSSDRILKRAEEVVNGLVKAKLVDGAQLPLEAARIYYRKEGNERGAEEGEKGVPPDSSKDVIADARVFVPRVIAGVGVSGHGVRIVFDQNGRITGLDLLMRDLKFEERPYPVTLSMKEAARRFENSLPLQTGAVVDVLVNEAVYYDPSMRDPVAFLEPGFLFAYRVRVPIEGTEKFVISKVLHRFIPAIDHDREQLMSRRKQRLQEARKQFETPKPLTPQDVDPTQDIDPDKR